MSDWSACVLDCGSDSNDNVRRGSENDIPQSVASCRLVGRLIGADGLTQSARVTWVDLPCLGDMNDLIGIIFLRLHFDFVIYDSSVLLKIARINTREILAFRANALIIEYSGFHSAMWSNF
jgi:hypothetical protein